LITHLQKNVARLSACLCSDLEHLTLN